MNPVDTDLIIKIAIAAVFGALIGYERQRYQKPAGMRTQMLICVGSALLAGLSINIALQNVTPDTIVRPDPARLMAQIVAGIGFIGGGVILKGNDKISGVTTAATIWLTAAVGIAVGAGFYLVGACCVVLALITHPLSRMKHTSTPKRAPYLVHVSKKQWAQLLAQLDAAALEYQVLTIASRKCEVRVFSSRDAKNLLLKKLDKENIEFEMTGG